MLIEMGSRKRKFDTCFLQILAHINKPIAEFFSFVALISIILNPDKQHRGLSVRSHLGKGIYLKEGGLFEEGRSA